MKEEKSNNSKPLATLLTGRFLVDPRVIRQWPYVLFLSALAIIMTTSSHNAERKVHRIENLRKEMKEMHSEFIDLRSQLMQESMESEVLKRAADLGLEKGVEPPVLISLKGADS